VSHFNSVHAATLIGRYKHFGEIIIFNELFLSLLKSPAKGMTTHIDFDGL